MEESYHTDVLTQRTASNQVKEVKSTWSKSQLRFTPIPLSMLWKFDMYKCSDDLLIMYCVLEKNAYGIPLISQ